MPAIFSEQQKEKLREQLLITGFELLKQFGYRNGLGRAFKPIGFQKLR